jgi:hypothetical protein
MNKAIRRSISTLMLCALTVLSACGGSTRSASSCPSRIDLLIASYVFNNVALNLNTPASIFPTITASGSTLTFTFHHALTAGALPTGLTLDPNTGAITGTPTGPTGTYPYSVTLSADCVPGTVTSNASITVQ